MEKPIFPPFKVVFRTSFIIRVLDLWSLAGLYQTLSFEGLVFAHNKDLVSLYYLEVLSVPLHFLEVCPLGCDVSLEIISPEAHTHSLHSLRK